MSGEEYLARKYCEPKAYWRCVHELVGGNYYSVDELNYPEYWLDAVAKYTQQKPSAAAKQLHRRVEAARAEFRHTSPQMLYSTYRELVFPGEAKRYWKLIPVRRVENVLSFSTVTS
jgi:hypothetical protein